MAANTEGIACKARKHESDAEGSETSLRKVVSVVLDVGIQGRSDAGDKTGHQPYPHRK